MQTSSVNRHDVLIAAGAVIGASVAYFLKQLAPGCSIAVVEPDDVYEFASTPRASGGARGLFSSRLGYARISANQPYAEPGIV